MERLKTDEGKQEMKEIFGGLLGGGDEEMTEEERLQAEEEARLEAEELHEKERYVQLMEDLAAELGEYTQEKWRQILSWCFDGEKQTDGSLVPYSMDKVEVNPTDDLELTEEELALWMNQMDEADFRAIVEKNPRQTALWIKDGVFNWEGYRKEFVEETLMRMRDERWATRYEFKAGFRKSVEIAKSRPGYKFGGFEDVEKMTDEERNKLLEEVNKERVKQNEIAYREGREGASSDFFDGVNVKLSDMPKIEYDGWMAKLKAAQKAYDAVDGNTDSKKKARLEADRDRIQAQVDKAREKYEEAERKKAAKAAKAAQK